MRLLPFASIILLALAALAPSWAPSWAQSGAGQARGRWGGPNGAGPNYLAVTQMTSGGLGLRLYQSDAPDPSESDLLFDNPAIISLPAGAASVSLTPQGDGSLQLEALARDQVSTYGETLYLSLIGNQVSVVRFAQEDWPADGSRPQVICDVDLQSGQAIWADEQTTVALPQAPMLDAASWTSQSAGDLSLCPSQD
ncbi:MAG: hypothetical protein JSR87_10600 [Proteobacteria bacterium]|nr:hypothetical protein [Pseudomonadota bacterium]MBS0574385.1 hypothetical protein [Pseudomonadota bacterium]